VGNNLAESGWIGENIDLWEDVKSTENKFFKSNTNLPDNILRTDFNSSQLNVLWSDDTLLHENGYDKLSILASYFKDDWVIFRAYSGMFDLSYEFTGTYPAYKINLPISFDEYIKHMHCAYPKSETGDETIHIISEQLVAFGSSAEWAVYCDLANSEVECIVTSDIRASDELVSRSLAKNIHNANGYGYSWDDERRLGFWKKVSTEYG